MNEILNGQMNFFFEKICCGAKFEFGAFAEIGRVEKKDVGHL